jgi:hypothetical protein
VRRILPEVIVRLDEDPVTHQPCWCLIHVYRGYPLVHPFDAVMLRLYVRRDAASPDCFTYSETRGEESKLWVPAEDWNEFLGVWGDDEDMVASVKWGCVADSAFAFHFSELEQVWHALNTFASFDVTEDREDQ